MPNAKSGDLNISYEDFGTGDTGLLILTGWCDNRIQFEPLAKILSSDFRVLLMDWRGHGRSQSPSGDFGQSELATDAESVIDAAGLKRVVPIAESHAGWVAIELKRRLKSKVPALAFLDWIVSDAPPEFLGALQALQSDRWAEVRDALFGMWTTGAPEAVSRYVRTYMGAYGEEMWKRAGREIEAGYRRHGSPLRALEELESPVPTLHLFSQPTDPGYLEMQNQFSQKHPSYRAVRLDGMTSHFPAIEDPSRCARELKGFLRGVLE